MVRPTESYELFKLELPKSWQSLSNLCFKGFISCQKNLILYFFGRLLVQQNKIEEKKSSFGYDGCFCINSLGGSGGLAVL